MRHPLRGLRYAALALFFAFGAADLLSMHPYFAGYVFVAVLATASVRAGVLAHHFLRQRPVTRASSE